METDKVAVILINYNSFEDTKECIDSIYRENNGNFRVYIVDNNSSDDSGDKLQQEFGEKCRVYLSSKNGGFSYGNNIGLALGKQDGCDKFLFLNNDTIVGANLIENMKKKCNKNTIVVPKTYYFSQPNIIWDTGAAITNTGRWINRGIGEEDTGQYDSEEIVSGFTGHCVMIDKKTIDLVGEWDESFFMYAEDTEYSLRMKKNGINILYTPNAKLWHKVSKSSGGNTNPQVIYYAVRNRKYVLNAFDVPFIWKIRNELWALYLLIKQYLQRDSSCKYVDRALKDYRKNVHGKVDFE